MKRALFFLLFLLIPFIFVNRHVAAQEKEPQQEETLEATVTNIARQQVKKEGDTEILNQTLELEVTKGSISGRKIIIETNPMPVSQAQRYDVGNRVLVAYTQDIDGSDQFYITDYIRNTQLYVLFSVFVVCAVVVGGIWGLSSLLGMIFSFFVIFSFILPQILKGSDPVLTAVLGACAIIPATFYLSHGVGVKTHVAVAGTLLTLLCIGVIATLFVNLTHLTGYAAEEAGFLQFELAGKVNMKGLLLAGIIISSLGILDDITISQASIVKELREANSKLSFNQLFIRAMRVGRDHIASLVNTLVLVYAGASLPLLLLFINNPHPFGEVINYEIVAEEIVRTLIGSIGLILAVPLTTVLAAFYFQKNKNSRS